MITVIPSLDQVLKAHAASIGPDLPGYRNHVYRVVNLCVAFAPDGDRQIEKIAIAAAFHDLGIWTDRTFDYLQPSLQLAQAHLRGVGRPEWIAEITEMILQHHKVSPYRGDSSWLVEPFRRADWVDVSWGLMKYGLPRSLVRRLHEQWPSAGFHRRLVALALERFRSHPLSPLPMVRR